MENRRRRALVGAALLAASPLLRAFQGRNARSPQGGSGPEGKTVEPGVGRFPLQVVEGRRHLVDRQGRPFLIHGDTPWSLMVRLSREEADLYLENRRAKGFNTILVNLIEHEFATDPPRNHFGEGPFLTPGDFTRPNERYFDHADHVVGRAAEKGFLVMMTPAYMGDGGGSQGWYKEMQHNGERNLRAYGRYLGNRFRGRSNILWVHGGDFNPPEKGLLNAIVDGIREADPASLHTFHGSRGTSATGFLGTGRPWLKLSNIYTDENNVVDMALREYTRSQRPFFLIEARYEGEGATEATVRQQAYQTMLSGGCGHLMGNAPVWMLGDGWQEALESGGARSLVHLRRLFEARAWETLVPDAGNQLLTSGVKGGHDRAVAGGAADGSFAILYMPSAREVSVRISRLAGPRIHGYWYDPSSGHARKVREEIPASAAAHTFVPPAGGNASGYNDWVLVLESSA